MAESVLNYQPLAPAINPVPPTDRRRARAAGSPPRRLSPTAGAIASGTRPRPPFECVALLLQGGGALGAYQAGVYQALTEAGLDPDWIAGISIGAINGALIAGNAPEARVDKLRAFWESVTANSCWDWSEWMGAPRKGRCRAPVAQPDKRLSCPGRRRERLFHAVVSGAVAVSAWHDGRHQHARYRAPPNDSRTTCRFRSNQ